jgi:predicted MarR family transcription regulator
LPEEQALKLILNYLRSPRGKKLKSEATAFDGNDIDDITYAREVYNRAKELITKRKDGKVNTELLNQDSSIRP